MLCNMGASLALGGNGPVNAVILLFRIIASEINQTRVATQVFNHRAALLFVACAALTNQHHYPADDDAD